MRVRLLPMMAILALLVASGCGDEAAGSDNGDGGGDGGPATITIGVSPNVNVAAMQIGIEEGLFEARDLTVELDTHQSSSASVPLLLNNEWQMTTAGAATVITAISEGIDIKIVSAVSYNRVTEFGASRATLVRADSGITSFAELTGKLGSNGLGSSLDIHTRTAVDQAGGDAQNLTSVEIPQPNAVAALRDGSVDAITVTQPFAARAAADPDLVSLGDPAISALGSDTAPIIYTVVAGAYAQANGDVLKRFLEALEEASELANNDEDRAREAASTLTELPVEELAQIPMPGYGTELDRDVLQREIDVLIEYADLDPADAPSVDDLLWTP